MTRFFLLMSSIILSTLFSRAQGIPVIQVETHLIDTTLSVRDANGGIVSGLTQDDFTVVEDGVPQKIRFFAHDNQLPLSIGLVIDASGSQEKFVKEHQKDIETFLHQVLETSDQAFALCFGNHLRLVSDSTASVPAIMDGIRSFDKGNMDFPEIGPKEARDRYGVRALDHLTTQTGGKTFDFHETKLKQDFNEIAGDLRSLYDLAYQSTNPTRDGTYRKVVIQATRPGLTVRARAGYYAR